MGAAIRNMLCSLLLVKELGVCKKFPNPMIEKGLALEEESDSSVCFESIVDDTTLFTEVTGHLHKFAELKGTSIETITHQKGIHGRYHEHRFCVSSQGARLLVCLMPAILENYAVLERIAPNN